MRGGAYRRLIGDPRFRRLWTAQFVSGIGDWLVIGFLMPLVTTLSGGSAFAVAGILIAKIVPALLFSSVTGVLVDRFDRRKVMIAADLVTCRAHALPRLHQLPCADLRGRTADGDGLSVLLAGAQLTHPVPGHRGRHHRSQRA
jgi:MFS family permease